MSKTRLQKQRDKLNANRFMPDIKLVPREDGKLNVRACIFVSPSWGIPYIKSLERSLIDLNITDKIDIEIAPVSPNPNYDLSFFVSGRKSISVEDWPDECKVLLQVEQLINCRANGGYHIGNSFDFILETFKANTKLRGAKPDRVFYCPIGYSPSWERSDTRFFEKDIDVLFWGQINPARVRIFQYIKNAGINIVYSSSLHGDRLYNHIARAKIIIWTKHSNCIDYAQLHCLPAQAQKEFVMAERSQDYGLFVPDVSFIVFDTKEDCLKKIKYYLKHEKERVDFAERAYQHLITIPYTNSLEGPVCNFLNHITEQKKS